MKLLRYLILVLFLVFFNSNLKADNSVYFIDLDNIIENSKLGKNLIKIIENKDKKNIELLKTQESKIIKEENEINKVKNILSQDELELRINNIKNEINSFNENKNNAIKELNQLKTEEYNNFFKKINPIIQEYMDKNSINILFSKKNIFIGKSKYDITEDIIKLIDEKF